MRASLNNALHSKLKILGVPAGNVPPAYDFRWAILGEIFDRQVQGILDGNAPSFAWEGNVDSVTSPKVVHEEPEPESEPKFTGFRKYLEYLGFGS